MAGDPDTPPSAEPDIVQQHSEGLVVLRRGRLFSIDTSGGELRLQGRIPAHAPEVSGERTLYWGLLQHENRVMVLGHSQARGALEVGLFDRLPGGELRYRDTVSQSGDERRIAPTYRAWLSGDTLVLYTSRMVAGFHYDEHHQSLRGEESSERVFTELPPPRRVYLTNQIPGEMGQLHLHTVTRCPVSQLPRGCRAQAVLGLAPHDLAHFGGAVYLNPFGDMVLRFPDTGAPQALRVFGGVSSAFRERGGHFEALMYTAPRPGATVEPPLERVPPQMRLLRVPLEAFGGRGNVTPREAYSLLPQPGGYIYGHFARDWLIHSGNTHGSADAGVGPSGTAYAVRAGSRETHRLFQDRYTSQAVPLEDGVLLLGTAEHWPVGPDLLLTSVDLSGPQPQTGAAYRLPRFRHDGPVGIRRDGPETGVVGVPVLSAERGRMSTRQNSTGVLYLRHRGPELEALGQLDSSNPDRFDFCVTSCDDPEGNARAFFVGDRIFALLGYELVEGRLRGGPKGATIEEVARLEFTPRRP